MNPMPTNATSRQVVVATAKAIDRTDSEPVATIRETKTPVPHWMLGLAALAFLLVAGRLGQALLGLLDDPARQATIRATYARIHREMRREANREAAGAVLALAEGAGAHG